MWCSAVEFCGINETVDVFAFNLKRCWKHVRNETTYTIDVLTIGNKKEVYIKLSRQENFSNVFKLFCEIIKYECLFDGCFFKVNKFLIDGIDYYDQIEKTILRYFNSDKKYIRLSQPINDTEYKSGFLEWEKYNKKAFNINQMYFYIGYEKDLTADMKIALFSEVFEPLSNYLNKAYNMPIINQDSYRDVIEHCPECNKDYVKKIKRKITLKDRIESVIQMYGNVIFDADDTNAMVSKIVKTRNKMLHVDSNKKDTLSGGQCGFYLEKFVDMYRVIVLQELKLWNRELENELKKSIYNYNLTFPKLLIAKNNK